MCRAVVGIRVDIKDVQAQFKLRQNKTAENRVGFVAVLKELRTAKVDGMATLIEKVRGINFGYQRINERYCL